MPELTLSPEPSVWSVVPPRDQAEPWARALIDGLDPEQTRDLVIAAELALLTRESARDGVVLLLSEPSIGLYAAVTVLVTTAPAADGPAQAARLALAISPSTWEPNTTEFSLHDSRGWRVSVAVTETDAHAGIEDASPISSVRTTYVFSVSGLLAVAQVSPLPPTAAALVMPLVEQLLPTVEVHDE